ncbi:MAG TPA: ECF transporter S component [Thermoanaerobacterales bacterium]|nr:ECF transporter S component [Thermoanaerobacterales bacterium]
MNKQSTENGLKDDLVLGCESTSKQSVMTKVAIMGAIAFIIMYFEFPLPLFVSFLKLDFSDVPAMLCSFALGPWAGVGIQFIKNLLKAIFNSHTAMVGEFANFVTGSLLVFPAGYIYGKKKNIKNAVIGMAVGSIAMSVAMSVANYLVMIPFYAMMFNVPLDVLINMGNALNPRIVDLKTLVLYSALPFNLVKGLIVSCITFVLYKRLSPVLKR